MERGSRSSPTFASSSERKKGQEKSYVVFEGRRTGVFDSWEECAPQVNGYSGNVHRSFKSGDEKGQEKSYVVFEGRKPGVFDHWEECAPQVIGYSHNAHRSFKSRDEAESAYKAYEHGEVGSSISKGEQLEYWS